jgi:hypothetical protein
MKTTHWTIKTILTVFISLVAANAYASTYYVRVDGGTASQCTGLADAAYPGSGTGQSCAFSHPFWAIAPQGNNPTKLAGGDTLIIDGSNHAQYVIGYSAPNTSDTSKCSSGWPWDCIMRPIPSGPSPSQPTRILGKGWDTGCVNPPQLWGNERVGLVLNLNGSNNVEIQCVEVTDHSSCQDNGPSPCNRSSYPYGPWSDNGMMASDSSNVLLKNVNIHGFARDGINAGRLKDWTLQNVQIVANSMSGFDGDIGKGVSSDSGTMIFDHVRIEYNGCGETYPGYAPYNCYSQSQGGYGDGLGTQQTGGNWVFTDSLVAHNTSDGIDLLYHDGTGTVTITRTRSEGNAGNQIKSATTTVISNSVAIGNCGYFINNPITWQSSTFDHCRAAGNTLALGFVAGTSHTITNSTITSNGNDLVISLGTTCNGTETLKSLNNVFLAGPYLYGGGDNAALYYPSGATGNADGPCGAIKFNDDYSVIYNTKAGANDCSGKVHSKCMDPKLTDKMTPAYPGNSFNAVLQSASPAIGAGLVLSGVSTLDYSGMDRGTSSWDIGALQFATSSPIQPSTSSTPVVALTSPANQSSFASGSTITLTATASENNGTIASVAFYNGSTLLGVSTTSPYSYTWSNVAAGTYNLIAKATDTNGVSAVSGTSTITVSAPVGSLTVALTSPTNQTSFSTGSNINMTASASETNGAVANVAFYNGSTMLGKSSSAPYGYAWGNVTPGTYTLTAKATDLNGVSTTSNPVTVVVNAPAAPVVSITSPTNQSSFATGSTINMTANASESNGTISSVSYYNGSTLLGTSTSAPYSLSWSNVPAGSYSLTAKAMDANGVSTTSSPVNVVVGVSVAPVAYITYPKDQMVLRKGSNLTIQASASETGDSIAKVDFYIFSGYLGTSTSAPYEQTWRNIKAGTYSFTVKATDSKGVSTTSKMITVYIK